MFEALRIQTGQPLSLKDFDADGAALMVMDKDETKKAFSVLNKRLETLQEMLYAEGKRRILIVLQGMDCSGKDSTIRQVFDRVNPQGVKVASFKVPTELELAHDYLWRVHQHVPADGEMVIFNRSHYEDVLVVRVHSLVPPERWGKRYEHICAFEKMLADEGTTIIKFYLHIDKDEQKERLLDRRDTPEKHWKFNAGDLKERKLWSNYHHAFEDALTKTSQPCAPWYVIPANRKWVRNYIVATVLVEKLESLGIAYPTAEEDISQIEVV